MKLLFTTLSVCMIAFTVIPIAEPMDANDSSLSSIRLISSETAGDWIGFDASAVGSEPVLSVIESNDQKTVIDVKMTGMWISNVEKEGQVYQRLAIPGHTNLQEVGKPEMPVIHALVAIPEGADIEVVSYVDEPAYLSGYRIHPTQEPTVDGFSIDRPFVIDHQAYQSTSPYPADIVRFEEPGQWRYLRVVSIEIAPVTYIADIERVEVTPHMVIELRYHYSEPPVSELREIEVEPQWDRMYRRNVLNYDWLPITSGMRDNPGPAYLIITHPNFESAIQPLAIWHHKEGMETEVLVMNTTSSSEVKNAIEERYDQGDLQYVLLVGDTNYMPIYTWSGQLSDYWYACITGAPDLYADIALGRLSVTNTTDAQEQVSKILTYEKDPPLDSWLNKITLVAHREDAPNKYVDCKEDIRTGIIPQPPYIVDTYYGHLSSGTNENVANAIDEGRNVVNYRGHGSTTSWIQWGWGGQSWTTSNVNTLDNGDWTPVVFNVACDNHKLTTSCLGEAWMNKYPGGAVASLGATNPSYTIPNHDYDKELFRQFCETGPSAEYRVGWIGNAAATYIIDHHGGIGQDNAKMYLWLGDPATEIWTDIPGNLTIDCPTDIPVGPQNVTITVSDFGSPVENATVCLYIPGEVYEVGTTGSDGTVSLRIMPASTGVLYVTVSQHDYLPYEGVITIYDFTPNFVLTMTPDGQNFPANSEMGYTVEGTNNESSPLMLQFWADVYLPGGNPLGSNPIFGPITVTLQPGQTASQYITHWIPGRAPLGEYTYRGYVGVHDGLVWTEDSFTFNVIE
jgi:hypothetical protein